LIDIGTGDGSFVWRHARSHPDRFCIGIDSNRSNLQKISEKIYRKPSKGGARNALFVEAAVEDLPSELGNIAEMVQIQFPWGSLLQKVATGEKQVLSNLRRICRCEALLKVIVSLDSAKDYAELARLQIARFDVDYVQNELKAKYKEAGFDIVESDVMSAKEYSTLQSSWAKRIGQNKERLPIFFLARAR
jgi:16S rRNA (adenine(1408)-N(1))-methyltransferase